MMAATDKKRNAAAAISPAACLVAPSATTCGRRPVTCRPLFQYPPAFLGLPIVGRPMKPAAEHLCGHERVVAEIGGNRAWAGPERGSPRGLWIN